MENVTGGTVKLQIKVDGVEIVNQDMDLCDALSQVTLMCPLGPGNHTAAITTTLPNDVPDVRQSIYNICVMCLRVNKAKFSAQSVPFSRLRLGARVI